MPSCWGSICVNLTYIYLPPRKSTDLYKDPGQNEDLKGQGFKPRVGSTHGAINSYWFKARVGSTDDANNSSFNGCKAKDGDVG